MALRYRFKRNTPRWHITWWTFEHTAHARHIASLLKYRVFLRAADRIKPWGIISGGTDCDGMRWASMSLCWTRKQAEEAAENPYEYADGPMTSTVVSGREARQWERDYEPDTRDRFAESMNY